MWGLRILCTKLHAKVYIPHLFPQHPSTLSDFFLYDTGKNSKYRLQNDGVGSWESLLSKLAQNCQGQNGDDSFGIHLMLHKEEKAVTHLSLALRRQITNVIAHEGAN